jgi:hypothetical protein
MNVVRAAALAVVCLPRTFAIDPLSEEKQSETDHRPADRHEALERLGGARATG